MTIGAGEAGGGGGDGEGGDGEGGGGEGGCEGEANVQSNESGASVTGTPRNTVASTAVLNFRKTFCRAMMHSPMVSKPTLKTKSTLPAFTSRVTVFTSTSAVSAYFCVTSAWRAAG